VATVSVLRSTAGLLVGIAIVVVVYVLVQFVAIGRLPTLATSTRALADPSERFLGSRALAAVHPRFRTLHPALLVSSGAVLAFSLMGSFAGSAAISTAIRLAYAATSAALLTFRRRARGSGIGGRRLQF
jgi:amino acid transporter